MKAFKALDNAMKKIENVYLAISWVMLFLIVALIFVDVVLRYLFNAPISGQQELAEMGTVIVVYFGLPYATRIRGHVRVEPITRKFSKKARNILYGMIDIICVVFMALLTWKIFQQALNLTNTPGNASLILRIPNYWIYFACALGSVICTIEFLFDGMKYFIESQTEKGGKNNKSGNAELKTEVKGEERNV